MPTTTTHRPTLGARISLLLLVASLIYFGLIRDWLGLRAILVAQVIFVAALALAVWRLPSLRRDGRPTPLAYSVSLVAGLLAGVGFGVVRHSPFLLIPAFNGALFGLAWVWLGHFLREPFGSTPWPPYPKE